MPSSNEEYYAADENIKMHESETRSFASLFLVYPDYIQFLINFIYYGPKIESTVLIQQIYIKSISCKKLELGISTSRFGVCKSGFVVIGHKLYIYNSGNYMVMQIIYNIIIVIWRQLVTAL